MPERKEIIASSPLFEGFAAEFIDHFASTAEMKEYAAGDIIYVEMQEADSVYVVGEGEVKLEIKSLEGEAERVVDMGSLGPGDPLGVQSFLKKEGFRLATATAVTAVKLLQWNIKDWVEYCEVHPEVGYRLSRYIAGRLLDYITQDRMHILDTTEWGFE